MLRRTSDLRRQDSNPHARRTRPTEVLVPQAATVAMISPTQDRTFYEERIHFAAVRVLIEDSRMREMLVKQLGIHRFKELFPELFEFGQ